MHWSIEGMSEGSRPLPPPCKTQNTIFWPPKTKLSQGPPLSSAAGLHKKNSDGRLRSSKWFFFTPGATDLHAALLAYLPPPHPRVNFLIRPCVRTPLTNSELLFLKFTKYLKLLQILDHSSYPTPTSGSNFGSASEDVYLLFQKNS